ncbi:DEAD/DEAH box helicase [Rhizobium sp. 2MFCol3.1]|uniref:DEAD/DEAH box helicase n=1 Tax=Rhizobium sp. 2MFCol3.1 TaxID=1246459 RepID=UPI0003818641|nr:DEAD/DEAH box helicase [Rhizobium sp. 2MFCol3.1]
MSGNEGGIELRVSEYSTENHASETKPVDTNTFSERLPAGFVATRLADVLRKSTTSLCYVALGEEALEAIARSIRSLFPNLNLIVFPPWDCLPYDRVPPTRQCMGRRMDALRVWAEPSQAPRLILTSLDAILQRVPPLDTIRDSRLELRVGQRLNRAAFKAFVERTGYLEEGVADDPGEVAVRDEVIDIFPAGATFPMRIVLSKDLHVSELRSYDPETQRTDKLLETLILGPASEAIPDRGGKVVDEPSDGMERRLLRRYDQMPAVFDLLGDARLLFEPGFDDRADQYHDIIDDARHAHRTLRATEASSPRSIYLSSDEWQAVCRKAETLDIGSTAPRALASFDEASDQRKALIDMVPDCLRNGRKVVVAGRGRSHDAFCNRLRRVAKIEVSSAMDWVEIERSNSGLFRIDGEIDEGFVDVDANIVLISSGHKSGLTARSTDLLAEPELRIGDVVVHEEHGVGVLTELETITIDGTCRDAARLEYRDGASLLVPFDEFDRLWRYGAEPDAVTLDRLHTDAWHKKRAKIAADIRSTAIHITALAEARKASKADIFVPPRATYGAFVRRFPYPATADQSAAIRSVLSDLSSGRAMNRFICGDVGFGKTEVALRAAAAVALSGGQVVVIVPTTVLARQHLMTFERRFAGSPVKVAMLSRLVKPAAAKKVKAGLADRDIGIVIATHAILAKDVTFSRLGLLVVDEEHRFGLKDKQAMSSLAPSLHTLTMSATPIPRTLLSAMVGLHDVDILATAPSRRRPVRTSLATVDRATMRIALMREFRRAGQSFVVVPRIEDIPDVADVLQEIVPELKVLIAHGKMPAADIDEAMVGFADGEGDILLSTNIIENGLDVPRANTMFIWNAEKLGLAQLHQLRGRVGRTRVQGIVHLLAETIEELSEEARLRLTTLVENDRLGSGLDISLRDLDLRGSGDIAGEEQTGHMRVIGTGLYHRLLEAALATVNGKETADTVRATLNIGVSGGIPSDYISDPEVRLDLHARLLRAASVKEVDNLEEEFDDRFGQPPMEVVTLLRLARVKITAGRIGISQLDAGPKALALSLTPRVSAKTIAKFVGMGGLHKNERLVFEGEATGSTEGIEFIERLLGIHS